MAKVFSFASWNVEHFRNDAARVKRAIEFLATAGPDGAEAPDVFAIYEVEGKQVYEAIMDRMPTHMFFISESDITQNILVGIKNSINGFVTQRDAFQSGVPSLRPGMLATLRINNETYSLLFLHMKADDEPRSWGLRDDMSMHIQSLKHTLDKIAASDDGANLLIMGDINNVGMNLTFSDKDFNGEEELGRYTARFQGRDLKLLQKTANVTFWNGSSSPTPPANLDHVYASEHLKFRQYGGSADVLVRGWPEYDEVAKQDKFIADYSDHALLYGEVQS